MKAILILIILVLFGSIVSAEFIAIDEVVMIEEPTGGGGTIEIRVDNKTFEKPKIEKVDSLGVPSPSVECTVNKWAENRLECPDELKKIHDGDWTTYVKVENIPRTPGGEYHLVFTTIKPFGDIKDATIAIGCDNNFEGKRVGRGIWISVYDWNRERFEPMKTWPDDAEVCNGRGKMKKEYITILDPNYFAGSLLKYVVVYEVGTEEYDHLDIYETAVVYRGEKLYIDADLVACDVTKVHVYYENADGFMRPGDTVLPNKTIPCTSDDFKINYTLTLEEYDSMDKFVDGRFTCPYNGNIIAIYNNAILKNLDWKDNIPINNKVPCAPKIKINESIDFYLYRDRGWIRDNLAWNDDGEAYDIWKKKQDKIPECDYIIRAYKSYLPFKIQVFFSRFTSFVPYPHIQNPYKDYADPKDPAVKRAISIGC